MENFEGQKVKYEGKETHIEKIYLDGTCLIANPDFDFDFEGECISRDIDYDVPYWITVKLSELVA